MSRGEGFGHGIVNISAALKLAREKLWAASPRRTTRVLEAEAVEIHDSLDVVAEPGRLILR
jgi:hypothetical protein